LRLCPDPARGAHSALAAPDPQLTPAPLTSGLEITCFPKYVSLNPPLLSGLEHVSGAENGAERPENRVEQSGAVSGRERKTVERSGARIGRSQSGNGAWSGLNWPLTTRSNVIFH